VLDKNGNKMSKRLGNAVDPFTYYRGIWLRPAEMVYDNQLTPWDNLKFDISGIDEVKRKFFRPYIIHILSLLFMPMLIISDMPKMKFL